MADNVIKAYYNEINKLIKSFCSAQPRNGWELDYLQKAGDVLKLYTKAELIIESNDQPENLSSMLDENIEEIKMIIGFKERLKDSEKDSER